MNERLVRKAKNFFVNFASRFPEKCEVFEDENIFCLDFQPHRKRESQHHVKGCGVSRIR